MAELYIHIGCERPGLASVCNLHLTGDLPSYDEASRTWDEWKASSSEACKNETYVPKSLGSTMPYLAHVMTLSTKRRILAKSFPTTHESYSGYEFVPSGFATMPASPATIGKAEAVMHCLLLQPFANEVYQVHCVGRCNDAIGNYFKAMKAHPLVICSSTTIADATSEKLVPFLIGGELDSMANVLRDACNFELLPSADISEAPHFKKCKSLQVFVSRVGIVDRYVEGLQDQALVGQPFKNTEQCKFIQLYANIFSIKGLLSVVHEGSLFDQAHFQLGAIDFGPFSALGLLLETLPQLLAFLSHEPFIGADGGEYNLLGSMGYISEWLTRVQQVVDRAFDLLFDGCSSHMESKSTTLCGYCPDSASFITDVVYKRDMATRLILGNLERDKIQAARSSLQNLTDDMEEIVNAFAEIVVDDEAKVKRLSAVGDSIAMCKDATKKADHAMVMLAAVRAVNSHDVAGCLKTVEIAESDAMQIVIPASLKSLMIKIGLGESAASSEPVPKKAKLEQTALVPLGTVVASPLVKNETAKKGPSKSVGKVASVALATSPSIGKTKTQSTSGAVEGQGSASSSKSEVGFSNPTGKNTPAVVAAITPKKNAIGGCVSDVDLFGVDDAMVSAPCDGIAKPVA
jgi:hypothetical protein